MILLVRILIGAGIILLIYSIFRFFKTATDLDGLVRCKKCDGTGYWYGTRERNLCADCEGTGKVPKGMAKFQ